MCPLAKTNATYITYTNQMTLENCRPVNSSRDWQLLWAPKKVLMSGVEDPEMWLMPRRDQQVIKKARSTKFLDSSLGHSPSDSKSTGSSPDLRWHAHQQFRHRSSLHSCCPSISLSALLFGKVFTPSIRCSSILPRLQFHYGWNRFPTLKTNQNCHDFGWCAALFFWFKHKNKQGVDGV